MAGLRSVIILVISASFCCSSPLLSPSTVAQAKNPAHSLDSSTSEVTFIGRVEEKSYFYTSDYAVNWHTAKRLCNETGLTLGTVKTAAQQAFLQNLYSQDKLPSRYFWLGGREARELRMFSWDTTEEDLPLIFANKMSFELEDYYISLIFDASDGGLHAQESKTTLAGYPLCET